MKVCLDICCLKRPFDSQEQALVRLETEAVMAILSLQGDDIVLVRTPAQLLENALNPVQWRREAVELWLLQDAFEPVTEADLASRTGELVEMEFKGFDALHLACAEAVGADVLLTVDERFLRKAQARATDLRVRVISPITFIQEVV
ncbi:MAG TPA: PIN domain-containing protein [Chromatiales bacterium]|nr:PIN domain-containing protein [Chromatiales bacterium]